MQTIGLIGGITPQSTVLYYEILNDLATEAFGEPHSCKQVIVSVDFAEIADLQRAGRWDVLAEIMSQAGKSLEAAGAQLILICANTMHLTIDAVRAAVSCPVLHIAEVTVNQIQKLNLKKVALLGTKYTMEKDFFKAVLSNYNIETLIPSVEDRTLLHDIIYQELAKGIVKVQSKTLILGIINKLSAQGAEGIILGCTEIPLLINQSDLETPVFDTTRIHATSAFHQALDA